MKKATVFILLMTLTGAARAQNSGEMVNYKVADNNPSSYYPRLNINLMIGGMELAGLRNIDGTNVYYGAFGSYMINDRLGMQASAYLPYLTLGKLALSSYPGAKTMEAGAMFFLTKGSKVKNMKVVLKTTRGTNSSGQQIQTTTFIMVPGANVETAMGLRGGFYFKNGPFGIDQDDVDGLKNNKIDKAGLTSMGIYAGIMHRSLRNLVLNTDKYGKCMNSLGIDFYADLMLVPYNRFTLLNKDPDPASPVQTGGDATDEVNKYMKSGPIGFRLGLTGFQIAAKESTGKKYGASYNMEVGYLPYQTWYLKAGIGITIIKKAK